MYTATVTVPNFKVAVYKDIRLEAGVPATIRVSLQIGGVGETVIVEAGAEMVQSQTANIATTMNVSQIVNLPTGSRSALEVVILMPGITRRTTAIVRSRSWACRRTWSTSRSTASARRTTT